MQWNNLKVSDYISFAVCKRWKEQTSNGKRTAYGGGTWGVGRQATSGYGSSDWWLLTDPCDCDWQALTTTLLAPASPHCWAQQVVWRLAEIPNKMDITGKNNSRPLRGECWARSTPPSHNVPGFTDSALFSGLQNIEPHSGKHLIEKAIKWPVVLSRYALWSSRSSARQKSETQTPQWLLRCDVTW